MPKQYIVQDKTDNMRNMVGLCAIISQFKDPDSNVTITIISLFIKCRFCVCIFCSRISINKQKLIACV